MPAFIKTHKDEERWAKAKKAVAKERGKEEGSFHDGDWALTNYIYHKMSKNEGFDSASELSSEDLRYFLHKDMPEQQSILGSEVIKMSEEKKYTAREAAVAVLKKAEELLKNTSLNKDEELAKVDQYDNQKHQKGVHHGVPTKANAGTAHSHSTSMTGNSKAGHQKILGELKAQPKPNLTKEEPAGEIHPKEPQVGESEQPGERIEESSAEPTKIDSKVNGNPEWGTTPGVMKGHIKLAKFCGHMHSKRKRAKPAGA